MRHLPPGSPVPGYLRRLLLADGAAGRQLFRRLYEMSTALVGSLVRAGLADPGADPATWVAFLLANDLVGQLGYAGHRREPAGALSGGTRQRLNLTLALIHDPDVLLLDEPYQGFDWETYLRFWDLVTDLRARGTAIVIITHLVFEHDRFDLLADLSGGRLTRRPAQGTEDHAHHPASRLRVWLRNANRHAVGNWANARAGRAAGGVAGAAPSCYARDRRPARPRRPPRRTSRGPGATGPSVRTTPR